MWQLAKIAERAKELNLSFLMRQLFDIDEFTDYVLDLNREEQLYKRGIDSEGKELTPSYAALTVIEKLRKSQPIDRVTLKDTGEFYKSFSLMLDSNFDFEIIAETIKESGDLADKYGEAIIGLTAESKALAAQRAKDLIIPIIRDYYLQAA
jgi:hypothetical protein